MMIIHRLVSPARERDGKEVDRLAVEVHQFIQEADNFVALSYAVENGAEAAPGNPAPVRAPLRMKVPG